MTDLSPQEIEKIDGVLLALMRGRAYQQWRRDLYIRAALEGVLAHAGLHVTTKRFAKDVVEHADAVMAAADASAQP